MLKRILFFLCLLQAIFSYAQFKVSGVVKDSIGAPIESVVVVLIDPTNGLSRQQGITTEKGEYNLSAKGNLQFFIRCLGYRQYVSFPFLINRDTILADIKLSSEDFILNDMVVVGEKQTPALRIEKGKMIFTPKNSSIIAGSTALEVLKKTPGIFVDGENNISIGGKNSVLVILNGKQTYMQKDELITLLKATPSYSVSYVEVMHNPSAQYDAEGSGGIININMSREKSKGFFLSFNNGISYWKNLRENTELSFNYTKNKLSLPGNYNHAFGYYNMDYGMHRIQGDKDYLVIKKLNKYNTLWK